MVFCNHLNVHFNCLVSEVYLVFVTLFHVWIHLSGKFIFLEEVVPFAPFQLHCQTLPIQQEQINKWNRHVIYWHGQHVPCSQGGQIQCSFKDVYLCKCTYHVSKIAGSKVILQITYKLNSINDLMDWMKTMPKTKYLQTQQPVLTCPAGNMSYPVLVHALLLFPNAWHAVS